MESFCGSWEAIDGPRLRKLAKPCSSAAARRRCYAQFLNLEAEPILRVCSQSGSDARSHHRRGRVSLKPVASSSTSVAALAPELWRNLDRLQEAELLSGTPLKALPTCFESHAEEGVGWKSAALVLAVGAIAGGGGFAAAMAMRPAPADPDAVPEGAGAPDGAAPAAGARTSVASPDGAPATDDAAAAAAGADADAGAPGVPPVAGAGLGVTLTPEEQEAAENATKLEQLQQIQAQRDELQERRKQVLERREELATETQPTLDDVDTQLKDLDVREGEITGIEVDHAQAIEAARQADVEARAAVQNVYQQVVPMVMQGQRINQIAEARLQTIQQRVPQLITDELNAGFSELTENLQLPTLTGPNVMDDLPPISLMVAGFAAPVQLKMLAGENISRLGLSIALLLLDMLSLGLGYGHPCVSFFLGYKGSFLKPWMGVDVLSLGFTVIVRAVAMSAVNQTLAAVDKMQNEIPNLPADPKEAFRVTLERNLLGGAQAMLQYDRLANSPSFKILDVLPVFDLIWQIGGIALLFDTPNNFCQARTLMYWARLRGTIFLIGFLPTVITLVLVIVKAAVASQGFCMAVLKGAAAADKKLFPDGPPVITVLVRAFLVRDTTDMARMELQVMKYETGIVQGERDSLRSQFEAAEAKAAKMEEKYAALEEQVERDSREAEFMRQYQEAMKPVLQAAEVALSTDPATAGLQAAADQATAQLQAFNAAAAQQQAAQEAAAGAASPAAAPSTPRGSTEETGGTGSAMFSIPPTPFAMPTAFGPDAGGSAGSADAPAAAPTAETPGGPPAPGAGTPGGSEGS